MPYCQPSPTCEDGEGEGAAPAEGLHAGVLGSAGVGAFILRSHFPQCQGLRWQDSHCPGEGLTHAFGLTHDQVQPALAWVQKANSIILGSFKSFQTYSPTTSFSMFLLQMYLATAS